MEVPVLQGMAFEQGIQTLEQPKALGDKRMALRIGVPREASGEERRVALAPSGAAALVDAGHDVYIESGAGEDAHLSDLEYSDVGATVLPGAAEVYARCNLIAKVAPPSPDELDLLQERQILVSALHLGGIGAPFVRRLMELHVTGLGFEFIRDAEGSLPIVRMMHEITGSLAVQVAAHHLESGDEGQGIMLGGISGIPPATVVILGAGVVGEWAARTALGFGAHVVLLDTDLSALRAIEHYLDRRVTTVMATPQYLRQSIRNADVVIGATMSQDSRAPIVVREDMIREMREGSVVVDAVIDQGGCIETSRPTSHSAPTFRAHGVIHYCVPNMPSIAARTATYALSNVLVPYLLQIGEAGSINDALWRNEALRNGTYVYRRHLTKKSLAAMFGMPHRDMELLLASGI